MHRATLPQEEQPNRQEPKPMSPAFTDGGYTCCGETFATNGAFSAHRKEIHLAQRRPTTPCVVWNKHRMTHTGMSKKKALDLVQRASASFDDPKTRRRARSDARRLVRRVTDMQPERQPRSTPRERRPRSNGTSRAARARAPDGDSDEPPACACGCGRPRRTRLYFEAACGNRARQRRFRAGDDGLGAKTVRCNTCGERLAMRTIDGLCGFCRTELEQQEWASETKYLGAITAVLDAAIRCWTTEREPGRRFEVHPLPQELGFWSRPVNGHVRWDGSAFYVDQTADLKRGDRLAAHRRRKANLEQIRAKEQQRRALRTA